MKIKMKVLQVIPRLGYGGAETGCYDLAHFLAEKNCTAISHEIAHELLRQSGYKRYIEDVHDTWQQHLFEAIPFEQYGEDFDAYCKDRYDVAPTEGESIKQITQRVAAFLEMVKGEEGTVLVVTHSGTLRGLLDGLLDYSHEEVANLRFKQTSLTSITIEDGRVTLDFINSTDHLRGSE